MQRAQVESDSPLDAVLFLRRFNQFKRGNLGFAILPFTDLAETVNQPRQVRYERKNSARRESYGAISLDVRKFVPYGLYDSPAMRTASNVAYRCERVIRSVR